MTPILSGPGPDETVRRYGPVPRVAALSDVHGNVPALLAVLDEPAVRAADLVVFCGDLTWGPEPERTIDIVQELGDRALLVRGNGDRAVVELARGTRPPERPRETWMLERHSATSVDFLAAVPFSLVVDIVGLGPVWFCHGSPRSDTELLTPGTAAERLAEVAALMAERTLVSGHTHLQFDRRAGGLRSVNPGSVGLPYHDGEPDVAHWAILGPDVALRQTRYDVAEEVSRLHAVDDPAAAAVAELLTRPPSVAEVVAHAEGLRFSD